MVVFKSKPIRSDIYIATIGEKDVVVVFCKERVVAAIADYNSVDWMESIHTLESLGYSWLPPTVTITSGKNHTLGTQLPASANDRY